MSDSVKVAIKVRPLINTEKEENLQMQWEVQNNNAIVSLDADLRKRNENGFHFDHIFDPDKKNSDVYDTVVKPIVEAAVNGFNGTVFAYGQTGSGKTYTMLGTDTEAGIIPLAIENMFDLIAEKYNRVFLLRVSYYQIYNEKVNDLLNIDNQDLKLFEDNNGLVQVLKSKEEIATSPDNILEIMKRGGKNRRIGETDMNEKSSRSHTIFRVTIESKELSSDSDGAIQVSQLNFVDLAGSERTKQTSTTGERFKEGTHINLSLSTLSLVIKQLSESTESQNTYINFRDSKLTRLLQASLGGNALTVMICTVTPATIEDTQCTLSFASRAKSIKNKPQLNEIVSDTALLKRYKKEISKLTTELEKIRKNKGSPIEGSCNKCSKLRNVIHEFSLEFVEHENKIKLLEELIEKQKYFYTIKCEENNILQSLCKESFEENKKLQNCLNAQRAIIEKQLNELQTRSTIFIDTEKNFDSFAKNRQRFQILLESAEKRVDEAEKNSANYKKELNELKLKNEMLINDKNAKIEELESKLNINESEKDTFQNNEKDETENIEFLRKKISRLSKEYKNLKELELSSDRDIYSETFIDREVLKSLQSNSFEEEISSQQIYSKFNQLGLNAELLTSLPVEKILDKISEIPEIVNRVLLHQQQIESKNNLENEKDQQGLEAKLADLESTVKNLLSEKTMLHEVLTRLNSESAALTSQVSALRATKTNLEVDLNEISDSYITLQKIHEELIDNQKKLQTRNERLRADYEKLSLEKETLKANLRDATIEKRFFNNSIRD